MNSTYLRSQRVSQKWDHIQRLKSVLQSSLMYDHLNNFSIVANNPTESSVPQNTRARSPRFPRAINLHRTPDIIHIWKNHVVETLGTRRADISKEEEGDDKSNGPRRNAFRVCFRDSTINRPGDLLLQSGWFPAPGRGLKFIGFRERRGCRGGCHRAWREKCVGG